jgi:hypothetical protein
MRGCVVPVPQRITYVDREDGSEILVSLRLAEEGPGLTLPAAPSPNLTRVVG